MNQQTGAVNTNKKRIILLHGWDWRKYPKFQKQNQIQHQWQNRQEFFELMKGEFNVDHPSLPGFTNNHDEQKPWELKDYTDWLEERIKTHRYDALVGYSFGAAIILKYLSKSGELLPAVLVSPAILRKYKTKQFGLLSKVKAVIKGITQKALGKRIFSLLRHIYLMIWVKNKFYVHGTPFLRGTYMNIVEENLSDELRLVLSRNNNIHLVFGGEDTITPPSLLFEQVPEAKFATILIEGGDHHIGTTHPQQLFETIKKSLEQTTKQKH